MSYIGLAINHARVRARMSNKALAEQTRLSQQYVGDVQRGYRIPSLETMLLFAKVFPDVESARWAWYVVRDLYGDPLCDLLWAYAVAEEKRRERDGRGDDPGDDPQAQREAPTGHGDLPAGNQGADGDPARPDRGSQAPADRRQGISDGGSE